MTTFPYTACPECAHLRIERAAIHEFDGGAARADAERWAVRDELCWKCRPSEARALAMRLGPERQRLFALGQELGVTTQNSAKLCQEVTTE